MRKELLNKLDITSEVRRSLREEFKYKLKMKRMSDGVTQNYFKHIPKNLETVTDVGKKRKSKGRLVQCLVKNEMAKLLGICKNTLYKYRRKGIVPEPDLKMDSKRAPEAWSRGLAYKCLSDLLIYFNIRTYVKDDIMGIIQEYMQEKK